MNELELFTLELKMRIIQELMKDATLELSYRPNTCVWGIEFSALGQTAAHEYSDIDHISNAGECDMCGLSKVIVDKMKERFKL